MNKVDLDSDLDLSEEESEGGEPKGTALYILITNNL